MIRVLMLNYEYLPLGGGTGIANYYLLKEFSRQKILQLDLLTSSSDNFREEKINPRIRIIRLNIGKKNQQLHHQSFFNLASYFIQATVFTLKHKQDYDLIHAFSGLPGGITAWLSGKPYIVSLRGADEPGYEPQHELFWKLFKPLIGYIYRSARSVDTNSLYLKNLVLKTWPDLTIQVINNGINTAKFYPAKKPVKRPIILRTSRLGERKGVEYLIKAMVSVPRAKLLLVGEGVIKPQLIKLTQKLRLNGSVEFLGLIDHDRLPAIYRRAKLFALPSLSESQSNSLLEALASGLPVVATNIGGNPELVTKTNGLLAPPADSQALAQAINQLIRFRLNPQSNQIYSWTKIATKYWQLYQRLSV